jgi:hypothetical protein
VPPTKGNRRPHKGLNLPKAPRVEVTEAQLAQFDAAVREGNDAATVERYFAVPPRERRKRIARLLQETIDKEVDEASRKIRASYRRGVRLEVESFTSSLSVLEADERLADSVKDVALEEARAALDARDIEMAHAKLAVVHEADEFVSALDEAREKAVAGAVALKRAHELWARGMGAACSRMLAGYLKGKGPEDAVERIASELNRPAEDLRSWLAEHEGDLTSDGPQPTADAAVAALVGKDKRSVRRWRKEPGALFFDEVLAIPQLDDPPPLLADLFDGLEGEAPGAGYLGATSGGGILGAALPKKP